MDATSSHQAQPPFSNITDPGLLALLGPEVRSFPFLEEAFVHSIKLRLEQERSRQRFYQVELASRNLAIMQSALRLNIPSHMIPSLCVSSHDYSSLDELLSAKTHPLHHFPPGMPDKADPSSGPIDAAAAASASASYRNHPTRLSGLAMSLDVPASYRFGGQLPMPHSQALPVAPISKAPPLMPQFAFAGRGPSSPSRLAVPAMPAPASATLKLPPSSQWPLSMRGHLRHLSMPAAREHMHGPRAPKLLPTLAMEKSHNSPGGGTGGSDENSMAHDPNSIEDPAARRSMHSSQNRHSPAVNVSHRRTHSAQPHREATVLQFEHWKPLAPGRGTSPTRTSPVYPPPAASHKRARSFSSELARALADLAIKAKTRALEGDHEQRAEPLAAKQPPPAKNSPPGPAKNSPPGPDDTIELASNPAAAASNPAAAASNPTVTALPPSPIPDPAINGSLTSLLGKDQVPASIPRIQCQPDQSGPSGPPGPSHNVGRYPRDILSPYSK